MVVTQPIPKAANKNGIANPAEYADNMMIPLDMEPPFMASVSIDPSTGPTHGDQPAEKKTPINADER